MKKTTAGVLLSALLLPVTLWALTVAGYVDIQVYSSAPGNPGTSGYNRLYSTSVLLGCKTSTGVNCLPLVGNVNAQTGNYTALPADSGFLLSFNSVTPRTVTLPASPPFAKWTVGIQNVGAGALTVGRNGLLIDTVASNLTLNQNQGLFIYTDGSNYFTAARSSSGAVPNFADSEVPAGAIDGANKVFTVAQAVSPAASLQLYLNGILQHQGRDYTLSGSTITYTVAPNPTEGGDWHVCWYRY